MSVPDPAGRGEAEVPLRERTWADHDEPWAYQPYHLSDLEKSRLLRRRERALAEEFGRSI